MSLWAEEQYARNEKERLGRRRARAIRNKNFTLAGRLGRHMRKLAQQIASLRRQRIYDYEPAMLDGCPGKITDACKRLISVAYGWAERNGTTCYITATTNGTHATNSFHYPNSRGVGRAVDINFNTEDEERRFQEHLRDEYGVDDFEELLGPANWAKYTSGLAGGPAPGHYGSNAHVHGAPKAGFRHS